MQVGRGVRTGRDAPVEPWRRQRDQGVSHVAIDLRIPRRPAAEVLDEPGTHVLPLFPLTDWGTR